MGGKYIEHSNHIISIQDTDALNNGIFDPTKFNDLKRSFFDLFGDEDVFNNYKNACLTDPESWKLFVKSGKAIIKQIEDTGIANKLKLQGMPVYLLDANYFADEYKKTCIKYIKSSKTAKDQKELNDSLREQIKDLGEAMTFIANENNKNAYACGILKEPEIEIMKK